MRQNRKGEIIKILTTITLVLAAYACGDDKSYRGQGSKSDDIQAEPLLPLDLTDTQNISLIDKDEGYQSIRDVHSSHYLLIHFFDPRETQAIHTAVDLYRPGNQKCKPIVVGRRTLLRDYSGRDFSTALYSINLNELALARRFKSNLSKPPRFIALDRRGNVMVVENSSYPKRILPICLNN